MNRTIIAITLIMLLLHSCQGPGYVPCNECKEQYPSRIYLEIDLANPSETPVSILVTVYEGPIDDNIVLYEFTTAAQTYLLDALLYKDYTVSARYVYNGKTYIAVDTATPSIHFEEETCEVPCYYVYNNKIDLRLRYD
ncbi:MAG: hypothetical protein MUC78_08540 [Bacteroidales bacterium]|jgi:hypothetical protein|nr:hypothetical protein [Bacteroidales bacterium]